MKGFRSLLLGGIAGKALGVVREVQLAYFFGTSSEAAAYRIAQAATLVPVNFFTADALSSGFLPNYSRLHAENLLRAYAFYRAINRLTLMLSVAIAAGLALVPTLLVSLLAPGVREDTARLAASMLVVMAVGVPFYVSTALASYLLMAHEQFHLSSVRASVQSLGLIAGTTAAVWFNRPAFLAWGFTGAYIALALASYIRVRPLRPAEFARSDRQTMRALARFWRTMRPMLVVPVAFQGAYVVERVCSSWISDTAVASVDYARLVTDTAVVLAAGPLGMAVLVAHSKKRNDELRSELAALAATCTVVLLPAAVLLLTLAEPLTKLLFERGEYDARSTDTTAAILAASGASLWAQVAGYVIVKSLSAQERTGTAGLVIGVSCLGSAATNLALHNALGPTSLGLAVTVGALLLFGGGLLTNGILIETAMLSAPAGRAALCAAGVHLVLTLGTDLPASAVGVAACAACVVAVIGDKNGVLRLRHAVALVRG
ncbi:lipid II flippase MurJ [Sporichthya polymorpha]|uniref:lipid II flippase MurJ n=1 Tax=Sporichthya polymorpha TaxID=35751 RepID=UPI00039F3A9F|nr:lipid II flippase MurJ [Sporichthya polymorpha]